MTIAPEALSTEQEQKRDELAGRLFETCLDALDIWAVYIGHHVGHYAALAERGALTSGELAGATETNERYAREWLEQQAATGILTVEDASADPLARRYRLEPGHAEVMLDGDGLSYLVPLVRYYVAAGLLIPEVVNVHRNGGGISWPAMGDEVREAQEGFNRALYLRVLGTEDLPAVPDIHARLKADPPARIADIGSGSGWSSIAIATAYPKVLVDGFDYDPAAVGTARHNAASAGVSDRVHFEVRDSSDPRLDGAYDLILFLECLHDMSHPVPALQNAHRVLAQGGAVVVMEERVAEEFAAPADDVDRMMYGWSIVQCLPGGMAETGSAGTGTVMRPATLRRYALEAGFVDVEVLPIDNDPIRRWYRLIP